MLKVEKKIGKNPVNKNQEDDITKIQNDKKLYKKIYILVIKKKKKKTIEEYAQLTTKIREEYAKLQQENNQLKIELHKYKTYVEQIPQNTSKNYYLKPIRKRKHYRDLQAESESDESDSIVTEICRRPRQQKRKRIIYEDELDRVPDYEPQSPREEEQEENDI